MGVKIIICNKDSKVSELLTDAIVTTFPARAMHHEISNGVLALVLPFQIQFASEGKWQEEEAPILLALAILLLTQSNSHNALMLI